MVDPIDAAIAEAEARLDAKDPVGAARCVERFEGARASHERLARLWARLLPAVGNPATLARQIRRLSAEWPRHPLIALTCAEAATRWADPWPPDAPRARLPGLAADVLARCIGDRNLDPRWVAPLHLARGRALARVGAAADDAALAAFEIGLGAAPEDADGWADLARFHQMRRRWAKGLRAADEALRHRPEHRAARWTAAVCATALADPGAGARWRALDHLPAGLDADGRPRVDGLPAIEVLLTPRTPGPEGANGDAAPTAEARAEAPKAPAAAPEGPAAAPEARAEAPEAPTAAPEAPAEAVWVHPISPVHGRIASPTVTAQPADFDDVVLWDPVPLEFRAAGDAEVPRFPALAVLGRGAARTWRLIADDDRASPPALPAGWTAYPFGGRVQGAAPAGAAWGKLITPRAVEEREVEAVLRGAGLRLEPPPLAGA